MTVAAYRHFYPAILAMFVASGCTVEDSATRTDAAYGQILFLANCADCHGPDGSGSAATAIGLGKIPPSLRQLSQRNKGVFPREYVMSVIDGFTRREHAGSIMPEFGEGDLGELVQVEEDGVSTPVPAHLLALANYLEVIQD